MERTRKLSSYYFVIGNGGVVGVLVGRGVRVGCGVWVTMGKIMVGVGVGVFGYTVLTQLATINEKMQVSRMIMITIK